MNFKRSFIILSLKR